MNCNNNKFNCFVMLLLLASCLMLSSCSHEANQSANSVNNTQSVQGTTSNADESTSITVQNKDSSSGNWKKAYLDYISTGNNGKGWGDYADFSLFDLDGDDTPELMRSCFPDYGGDEIITFRNNQIISIVEHFTPCPTVFEGNSGYLWICETEWDYSADHWRYYKYDKDTAKLNLLYEGTEIYVKDDPTLHVEKYLWRGKEVSEDEYYRHVKEEVEKTYHPEGNRYGGGFEDEIVEVINSY